MTETKQWNTVDYKKEPTKLIIDTDAGSDDAVAIAMAIRASRIYDNFEILAITCVSGNTSLDNVVVNVLKTLTVAQAKQIPVYIGLNRSIVNTPQTDSFFGDDGLGDFDFPDAPIKEDAQKEHAVDAMIRLVKENLGQITLVALGPLSNVAMAIRLDPTFRRNLKDLYVLGGNVAGLGNIKPGVEFNFFMDPEASHIVFSSTTEEELKPITLVPWETIIGLSITKEWRRDILGKIDSDIIKFINKAESKSLENSEDNIWRVADGALMAIVIDQSLVLKVLPYTVTVVLQGEARGGMIVDYVNNTKKHKNTAIVFNLDVEKLKNMCIEYFSD